MQYGTESDLKSPITRDRIIGEYQNDKILLEVIEWVKNGKRPEKMSARNCHEEIYHYWKNFQFLTYKNGILYITRRSQEDTFKKIHVIVLPYTTIQCIFYNYHFGKFRSPW